MLCENCRANEAAGYIEENRNGIKRRINLCSKCLIEKQRAILGGGMFAGFVNPPAQKLRCSKCGTDLKTIINTLFVGCPDCYAELDAQLNPIIKNLHNAAAHVGSMPGEADSGGELRLLSQQLKAAVKDERFEDAAAINRRIKNIREGK